MSKPDAPAGTEGGEIVRGDVPIDAPEPSPSRLLEHCPEERRRPRAAPELRIDEGVAAKPLSAIAKSEKRASHELTLIRPESESETLLARLKSRCKVGKPGAGFLISGTEQTSAEA